MFFPSWLQVPCRWLPWRIWGRITAGADRGPNPRHASRCQALSWGTHNYIKRHNCISISKLMSVIFRLLSITALHSLGNVSYETLKMLKQGKAFGICMDISFHPSSFHLVQVRYLCALYVCSIKLSLIVFPENDWKLSSLWIQWSRSFHTKTHSMRASRNTWKESGPSLDR